MALMWMVEPLAEVSVCLQHGLHSSLCDIPNTDTCCERKWCFQQALWRWPLCAECAILWLHCTCYFPSRGSRVHGANSAPFLSLLYGLASAGMGTWRCADPVAGG